MIDSPSLNTPSLTLQLLFAEYLKALEGYATLITRFLKQNETLIIQAKNLANRLDPLRQERLNEKRELLIQDAKQKWIELMQRQALPQF